MPRGATWSGTLPTGYSHTSDGRDLSYDIAPEIHTCKPVEIAKFPETRTLLIKEVDMSSTIWVKTDYGYYNIEFDGAPKVRVFWDGREVWANTESIKEV